MIDLWSFVAGATVGVLVTLSIVDEEDAELLKEKFVNDDD